MFSGERYAAKEARGSASGKGFRERAGWHLMSPKASNIESRRTIPFERWSINSVAPWSRASCFSHTPLFFAGVPLFETPFSRRRGDGRDLYVVVCEDIYFVKILKFFLRVWGEKK